MATLLEPLHRDALRCENRQCRAYINRYCEVEDGAWRCVLCGRKNRSLTLDDPRRNPALMQQPEFTDTAVECAVPP